MNPKSKIQNRPPPSLVPKKSLGQNFLRDPNTIRKIVGSLEAPPGAHVVEIGPGTGALTAELIQQYPVFTAVEVDDRAVEHLHEAFPQLDVRHADVLDFDWADLATEKGGPLYVIGNLPYYITSQILFGLIDHRDVIREAVVMMQLEVAERLVAAPRTKAYGILSVQLQLFSRPDLLFRVPPTVFYPRPDVTSAVVRLRFPDEAGADALAGSQARAVSQGGADGGAESESRTQAGGGAGTRAAAEAGAPAAAEAGAQAAAEARSDSDLQAGAHPPSDLSGVDIPLLKDVVRTAFNQRRKTLRNSLSRWTRGKGIALPNDWENRRAEELAPGEFVELTRYLQG